MAKTTYKVTTAEGKIETRKSEHAYTAVLLGRLDYVAMRERERRDRSLYTSNFNYYMKLAARTLEHPEWSKYDTMEERQRQITRAQAEIAGHTLESYSAAKIAEYIARYCPEGQTASAEVALRWSRTPALAQNAIGEFAKRSYTDLRVVEVTV